MKAERILLAVSAALLLLIAPVFASQETRPDPKPEAASEAASDEALSAEAPAAETSSAEEESSNVNYTEEFGFGSRQNVDQFLGDIENPFASPPEQSTYDGSVSDDRTKRDDSQWWR